MPTLAPPADLAETPRQTDAEREAARRRSLAGGGEPDRPPGKVPGCTLHRPLGRGGFGSVWAGTERATGRPVAVKFFHDRAGLDWPLLTREVEKLAALDSSRNIVGLYDVGWDAEPPYYVMEHMPGGSLADLTGGADDGEPLPVERAVRLAKGILRGLANAHAHGILHCDLKPGNVLLDDDDEPRLCDFGQARFAPSLVPPAADQATGTLFFMAPEQAVPGAVPDARWDVYALGAVLFQLLTGTPPRHTDGIARDLAAEPDVRERLRKYRAALPAAPPPGRALANRRLAKRKVDRRLAHVVDRCLSLDPRERYANAQAVLSALKGRDRARARRPLVWFGLVGPVVLTACLAPLLMKLGRDAVDAARDGIVTRALESDLLSARVVAGSLEREVDRRARRLEAVAANPPLAEAIAAAGATGWADRTELARFLNAARRADPPDTRDSSWFLTDAAGRQRWRWPPSPGTADARFDWRDYFHGRGEEYPPDAVPADVAPLAGTHVSLPFRSDATGRRMIAVSTPVRDADRRTVGVLARTLHLGLLIEEYAAAKRSVGGADADAAADAGRPPLGVDRVVALLDRRTGELLDHPWIDGNRDLTPDQLAALRVDKAVFDGVPELDALTDYRDPVAAMPGGGRYAGEWLAALATVDQTAWLTLVQERRADALNPVEAMRTELLRGEFLALLTGGAAVLVFWALVARAIRTAGRGPSA